MWLAIPHYAPAFDAFGRRIFAGRITASAETLLRQASMTADTYMGEAVERVDRLFGDGYAWRGARTRSALNLEADIAGTLWTAHIFEFTA